MTTRMQLALFLAATLTACAEEPEGFYQFETTGGAGAIETPAGGATSVATSAAPGGATVAALGGSSAAATTVGAGGATYQTTAAGGSATMGGASAAGGAPSLGGATGTGGTTSAPNTYTILVCPHNCREINMKDQDRGVVPVCNLRCGDLSEVDRYSYLFGFRAHDCMAGLAIEPITPKQMEQWDLSPVCPQ